MIPFLKKNKDGKKPPKPTVPRTAQESIPFQRMFEDGTCRVRPGYYTRTIQYQDINYQLAQQEDKTAIFEEYFVIISLFIISFKAIRHIMVAVSIRKLLQRFAVHLIRQLHLNGQELLNHRIDCLAEVCAYCKRTES